MMMHTYDLRVSDIRAFSFREFFTLYKLSMQCKSTMCNTISCFIVTFVQLIVAIWLILLIFLGLKNTLNNATNIGLIVLSLLVDFILTSYLLSNLKDTHGTIVTRIEKACVEFDLIDEKKTKQFEDIIAGKSSQESVNELAVSTSNLHIFF